MGVIKQSSMKVRETVLLACLYSILAAGFGFWWAENFHDYTHFKGDESFFEIEIVGLITLIALVVFRVINRRLSWWFIAATPFLIGLLSVFSTLFFPFTGLIGGTTLDNLRVYGVVHTLLTFIIAYFRLQAEGKNVSAHA